MIPAAIKARRHCREGMDPIVMGGILQKVNPSEKPKINAILRRSSGHAMLGGYFVLPRLKRRALHQLFALA
jgi:hypothetical protein